jgi:glycerate kinase
MTTVNAPMSLEEALQNAETLYYEGAVRMFRFVKAGMDVAAK